ncbi:MAG: MFS transporter, partial [Dehalococcoidia bacterium]
AEAVDRRGGGAYASAYAIFNGAYAAGMMAGPMLGGSLSSAFGFSMALLITGGIVLLYVPVLLFNRSPSPQPSPARGEGAVRLNQPLVDQATVRADSPLPGAGEGSGVRGDGR